MPVPTALLDPLQIGPVRLCNRVVSTSHQTGLVHDNLPTGDLIAYHAARACGGVGAIFLEATAVDPSGLLTAHTLGGFLHGIVPCYRLMAAALHAQDARLFVQLFHGGREQIASAPRSGAVAPSAVPSPRFRTEPRALTRLELGELLDGYATAARNCREGGVDGIEVSMAHGYLFAQFFSPRTNRRTDAYADPLRFATEVLEAVRDAAGPELAVGVRLTADERTPDGLDPAACAELAAAVCATGLVDFASFVLGHSATFAGSSWIVPPPPAEENAIAGPLAHVDLDVPVIAATRVLELAAAEALVVSGAADAVGMTRALIADPALLAKARRGEPAIACIGCNQACIGHYHAGVPIGCTVNPRTGRERRLPAAARGAEHLRVLVVGGGPAGVSAALEAAEHGDAVTLLEQADALGGQLRLAGLAPAHRETWRRWRASAEARLARAGVDVRLDAAGDAESTGDADVVVLATGARPFVPELPPLGAGVVSVDAWSAVASPEEVAGPALVADWGGGWEGLDAAERLAEAGLQVTLACAAPCPGDSLHQYQRNLYLARLDELGVVLLHHVELAARPPGLRHVFSGRPVPLPAARTLVLAQGRVPDDGLWAALEGRPGRVRAGDVLGPRSAEEAVLEGVTALRAARAAALPARG